MTLLRSILPAIFAAASIAAASLEVVRPAIGQTDGGPPEPAAFEYSAGATLFFTCHVAGFQKSPEEQIHLAYSVQAFDPKGVALVEPVNGEISAEIAPQDKNWTPLIHAEIPLPPLIGSGKYSIAVKVSDLLAKTQAELPVPVEVRGHEVEPSETLVIRNFRFFRGEDDLEPLAKPVYRPGDEVWARFDIIGFHYGAKNRIDVSYVTSVLTAAGKLLWTQPEPVVEQTESFYPKRYIPASGSIVLQKTIHPGEYTIAVEAKDSNGNQTCSIARNFTVE